MYNRARWCSRLELKCNPCNRAACTGSSETASMIHFNPVPWVNTGPRGPKTRPAHWEWTGLARTLLLSMSPPFHSCTSLNTNSMKTISAHHYYIIYCLNKFSAFISPLSYSHSVSIRFVYLYIYLFLRAVLFLFSLSAPFVGSCYCLLQKSSISPQRSSNFSLISP